MQKDELLNIKPKKNIKKPLIYGAVAFLVFIIGIVVYAIYSSSTNKENVVLPPQVNETPKQISEFKEVPIEDANILSQKLIKNEKNNSNIETNISNTTIIVNDVSKVNEFKEPKKVKKTEILKTKKTQSQKKVIKKYYIQVAALIKNKKPDKKFLNLIKKEGFNYKTYKTTIVKNNKKIQITKILIGPFENEIKARKILKKVKEKITQNAFIFKVK